jgi:hypothetical protein
VSSAIAKKLTLPCASYRIRLLKLAIFSRMKLALEAGNIFKDEAGT